MRKYFFIATALALSVPLFGQETSEALWTRLMVGNAMFVGAGGGGALTTNVQNRMPTAQNPRVTVLSCADSRVPPELVFNQTIGDLFVVRTAGNVAGPFDIASIEYAIGGDRNWTRMIVVLGHSNCGAVSSALTATASTGSTPLDALLDRIRESFVGIAPWRSDPQTLRRATDANARYAAQYLLAHSKLIREATTRDKDPVIIIPAYYDLVTGRVQKVP